MTAPEVVLVLTMVVLAWMLRDARRDDIPATARAIRRAQRRNKADLRKMRGR